MENGACSLTVNVWSSSTLRPDIVCAFGSGASCGPSPSGSAGWTSVKPSMSLKKLACCCPLVTSAV
jgi:hypothetical protein